MSVMGFEVHVDKENATPAPRINKGGGLTGFGSKDKGKLLQPTPRKALFDVNYKTSSNVPSRGLRVKEAGSTSNIPNDTSCKSLKAPTVFTYGAENGPVHSQNKKPDMKKAPSLQKKGSRLSKADGEHQSSKMKPPKLEKKIPPSETNSGPDVNDEEYDSDSIFPRAERLSSYVDKLFAWRPPCLFGTIPDSESEASEPEDLTQDDFVLEIPLSLAPVPEFSDSDLADLMGDLPPPVPDMEASDSDVLQAAETDLSLNTTADTSLSLGSLQVMHDNLDISNLQSSHDQYSTES